jgi:hypothetical protein
MRVSTLLTLKGLFRPVFPLNSISVTEYDKKNDVRINNLMPDVLYQPHELYVMPGTLQTAVSSSGQSSIARCNSCLLLCVSWYKYICYTVVIMSNYGGGVDEVSEEVRQVIQSLMKNES